MSSYYNYTECGLENVWISGVQEVGDHGGNVTFTIKDFSGLQKAIAQAVVRRSGMSGPEIRFLRTELGMTQAQLAKILHVHTLSVGRWEREEAAIDKNAETVFRALAIQRLNLGPIGDIEKLSALGELSLDDGEIIIEWTDGGWRPIRPKGSKKKAA
jgi:DNA-binding transcriptional regulator YiaG